MIAGAATTYLDFQFYEFEYPQDPNTPQPFTINEDDIVDLDLTGKLTVDDIVKLNSSLDVEGNVNILGITTVVNTANSSNKDTGAVIIKGGVGISKNLNVGENITVDENLTLKRLIIGDGVNKATILYDTNTERLLTIPSLGGNRTFAFVDQAQTFSGTQTFSSSIVLSTEGTATNHAVRADRSISTGDGLNGGGNLTSNRTFSVDSTVVRTSGDQTIGGTKTFSSAISAPQNNNTSGGGISFNGAGNAFIRGRNQDGASNTLSNLQLQSWFGIGFGPSISGQTVPIGENAFWINVRNGSWASRGSGTVSSNLTITGALSKGSGSFRIPHPLPELSETHDLVHSFIEGPRADLIYRGKVVLIDGVAQVNLDEYIGITSGTWELLCRDPQVFLQNNMGWDLVKGSIVGNVLFIESKNKECNDEIDWCIIAERKDSHIYNAEWTDDNGRPILEPLKN